MLDHHPGRDERDALALEDLASALEAGLPLASLGPAGDGDSALAAVVAGRGLRPSPSEAATLAAGWRAGRAVPALRNLAQARRRRATTHRELRRRLAYPLLLATVAFAVSLLLASIGRGVVSLPLVLAPPLAFGLLLVAVLRALRSGQGLGLRLPLVGDLAQDLAELPYLEALHGLYASGVPLLTAHTTAVQAAPPGPMRSTLEAADRLLAQHRPLAEALHQTGALHPETRTLLAAAEPAGQLEDALARALRRRTDSADRRAGVLARTLGTLAYTLAVLTAGYVIVSFYASAFGALRPLR